MGNEPRGIQGYYPGLAAAGLDMMGDDFSGWGRFDKIVAGDRNFKTICECRLEQRWAGRHGHSLPAQPSPAEFLRALQRGSGTDSPSGNSVFLRCDNPEIPVTAQILYGSGAGIDEFYCSVGAGTSLQLPGTYWRVSMRVDQISLDGNPAFPETGTEVTVGALIGRGTGAQNTRPHLDRFFTTSFASPGEILVPARADSFKIHVRNELGLMNMSLELVGLGGVVFSTMRSPLIQNQEYLIPSGVNLVRILTNGAPAGGLLRFLLT